MSTTLPPPGMTIGQWQQFWLDAIRVADLPDLGAVSDTASFVGELAGTGRFGATALRSYVAAYLAPVANIAALRNSSGLPSPVQLLGYYATADGGEGRFAAMPGDTTSADNSGTIIVDHVGMRWKRLTGSERLSVKWFGATGNGTTNDTVAIQGAIATGQPIYIPPGQYLVLDAINCTTNAQVITGAGRWATTIMVSNTFNMSASGVFVLHAGEPGAYLRDFAIQFFQPDTAARGSLIGYPAAIYASAEPRFMLERLRITNAMVGVNMLGNSGGATINDLQCSCYTTGIWIDGCTDTVRVRDAHFAGFAMTANQLSIAQSAGTICISSGRCDDLKLDGCLFLFNVDLYLWAGTTGYTFGSAVNCSFDGFNGVQSLGGGKFSFSGCYFTLSASTSAWIDNRSGYVYCADCWFGGAVASTTGYARCTVATGAFAVLEMVNCSFHTDSADTSSIIGSAGGTGSATVVLSNCQFIRTGNIAFVQPTVSIGTGTGSYLTMMGCRTSAKGTGTGLFINIGADNWHRVIGNASTGWSNNFPTATNAVYQYN
jgi:hypothetical protein